ncbi:hypothetical protein [Edaphobacter aggregans]|uniref:hypothetical protein n=1 Tax=Edaphobacter aggregans TaxID=570835 RepID=UPI00055964D3|nr:hypothetical protein [Edaphobacter aggregans]
MGRLAWRGQLTGFGRQLFGGLYEELAQLEEKIEAGYSLSPTARRRNSRFAVGTIEVVMDHCLPKRCMLSSMPTPITASNFARRAIGTKDKLGTALS